MVQAQLGYAADREGRGVAYARLTTRTGERLVRAAFRVQRYAGLGGREVSYAALTAIAALLYERGLSSIAFHIPDAALVADRAASSALPPPLGLPYVRLGCALNRFDRFRLEACEHGDLTARAQAEVVFHSAA
jgi:hypothetical protein